MVAARHSIGRALSTSQAGLYVCRNCRNQLFRTAIPLQQHRFASNDDLPTTEKARRNIWGTDNPPGLSDLYGGPSSLEKRRAKKLIRQSAPGNENLNTPEVSDGSSTISEDRAAQKSQLPVEDKAQEQYTPAETWHGLKYVGSNGNWHDVPPQPTDKFSTWLNVIERPATNRDQLLSCLHQALIECLTCLQAGLQPQSTLHLDSTEFRGDLVGALANAKISVTESGSPGQVEFASEEQAKRIVEILASVDSILQTQPPETISTFEGGPDALSEPATGEMGTYNYEPEPQPESQTVSQGQGAALHYLVEDESFLETRFDMEDPLSFDVLKRFSQLSGHRIPDPLLNTLFLTNQPLSFLVDSLYQQVVRPKPKRVADVLLSGSNLSSQSNVMIFPRRETPVDKEKEVGRWKVIEKELQLRGLPVLGKIKA